MPKNTRADYVRAGLFFAVSVAAIGYAMLRALRLV